MTLDKTEFVKRLNGTAIYWHEVWEILTANRRAEQQIGEVLKDCNGEITRENVLSLMKMLGEQGYRWWSTNWVYQGRPYGRQAQVEQEFDMWFEDLCHEQRKFLPNWFADKARIQEKRIK